MAAAEGGGGQVAFSRLVSYCSGSGEMPVSRLSYTTSGASSYSPRRPGAALYPSRSASLDRGPLASSISSRYRPSALTTTSSSSRRPPSSSTLQRRRCDSSGSTRLPGLECLGPVTEARRYLNERRALDNHPDTYRQQRYARSESRDEAATGADRVAERVRSFEAARSGLERLVPITLETDDGGSVVSERERRPSVTELRQKFDLSDPLGTRAEVKPCLTNGHAAHAVTSAEDAVKTAAASRFVKSSCVGSQGLSVSTSTGKPTVSKYGRVSTSSGSSPESDDRSSAWSSTAVDCRPLRRTIDPDAGRETARSSGEGAGASYRPSADRPTVLLPAECRSDATLLSSSSRTVVTSPADPSDAGRLRALDGVDARSESSALTNGHSKCRRLAGSTGTDGGDAVVRSPTSSLTRTRLASKDTASSKGSKTSPGAAASVKDASPDVASSPVASATNGERLSVTRRDPVRDTSSSETASSLSDTNSCGGSPASSKRMVMSSGLEASRRPTERIRGGRTSSSQHLLLPVVSLTEASITADSNSSAENGKISGSSGCESGAASARRPAVTSLQQSAVAAVTREDLDSQLTQQSDRRRHGLTGLRNIGNTCFMNSVLQCLSNTSALHPYILQREFGADINKVKSSMQGALVKAFAELVGDLWRGDSEHLETCRALTTAPFKAEIQRFAPRFMGYQQQDAQEFLRYLLEGLHEDVNRVRERPRPITTDIDDSLSDAQKAMESWKRFLRCENSKFVDLFVGQLKSTLRCVECGHESVTFDPFWDLSLPIPCRAGGAQVRLQACFDLFTSQETLDGDEKPTCSQCEKRQKCTKRFSIQRFPRILVVHLKRFNPAEKYRGKLNSPIDLPLCGLDLSHYSSGPGPCRYNLYGVANHSGTLYSGHYTACCRHPYSGQWHEYNDSRVNSVSVGSVVTKEAYVLFFELADSAQR